MGCTTSKSTSVANTKPKVLVLGASGYIGQATLSSLVSRHGSNLKVYAGVRDPTKFDMEGVSTIKADMNDKATLTSVLRDFDRLYIVTPGHEQRTQLAINAVEAAKAAGVKFVLGLSVATTGTDTIFGKQFVAIEKSLKTAGLKNAIVRLPIFMDNFYANAQPIKENGTFYDPRDPTKPHTPVTVADAGKASADILAHPEKHFGKVYTLVMPSFTLNEAAEAFSSVLGKDVTPTTVPYPAAKEAFMGMGFPEWQVDGIMELYNFMDNESPLTNNVSSNDIELITGEKPMDLKAWVTANKAGFA